MPPAARDAEIDAVDTFLREGKHLVGDPPAWRNASHSQEQEAIWPIADAIGVIEAELRFRYATSTDFSASVLFRGNPIWRVDIEPVGRSHPNPPDAHRLGLAPTVDGPHEHRWDHNRSWLLSNHGWRLHYRIAIPARIRRVEQLLPFVSERVNLSLAAHQRDFGGPPQGVLL